MIRAVWDTNVLASAAIAHHGILADLTDSWRSGDFMVVVSEQIVVELERTLHKPYFRDRLTDAQRARFDMLIQRFATIVAVAAPIPSVLSQRADNIVLATAISAQAPFVVTGDREMRNLANFQGVRIVSAREFFEFVSRSTPGA